MARARLAEILQKRNLVSDDQYEQARRHARGLGDHAILHALGDLGFISGEAAIDVLSEHLAIPRIDLSEDVIDPQVSHLLPEELLRRHTLFPFQIENDSISLAICPPIDLSIVDEIELTTGYSVTTFLAPENEIRLALNQHFNTQRRTRQTIIDMHVEEQIPLESGELVIDDVLDAVDSPPVVRLVVDIIDGAINERASDIHLEPQEDTLRIRYRIDGVLHDVMQIPRHVEASVISRIKILSNMDITEKRASQDGHISIKKGSGEYDIRVATYLTINGEKIVMRLLSKETMLIDLEGLGLNARDLNGLTELIERPYGMILVTGPTGCGKTTTLYSILNRINNQSENIVTIEDPVEYKLPGINQSQVSAASGVTFATGLRSILRQDPNIMMVGEIRDSETAKIANQASITGHLVFSTLHTSNASNAITRLVEMGVKEYLISASLIGVVAQRLIRVICPYCKEAYKVDVRELFDDFGVSSSKRGKATLYRGKGCKFCSFTGYQGRLGIFEVMKVTENIQNMILNGRSANEIRQVAIQEGMSTLRHSAFRKVVEGVTTFEEVRRSVFISID